MQKTYALKASEIQRDWWLVDAEGQTLGRLATQVATLLRGKHKPAFATHLDNGDFVVVVNAEKIKVTGNKLDDKMYYAYSGYPGGLRETPLRSSNSRISFKATVSSPRRAARRRRVPMMVISPLETWRAWF